MRAAGQKVGAARSEHMGVRRRRGSGGGRGRGRGGGGRGEKCGIKGEKSEQRERKSSPGYPQAGNEMGNAQSGW